MANSSPRRRTIIRAAWISLTLIIVAAVSIPLYTEFEDSWNAIRGANWWLLAAAFGAQATSFVSFALLSRGLLAHAHRPKFSTLMKINITGNSVAKVIPGGGPAAAAFRFTLLDRAGVPKSSAIGVAALESAVQIIWYVVSFGLGILLALPGSDTTGLLDIAALVAIILLAALIGAFAVLMIKPGEIVNVVHAASTRIKFLPEEKIRVFTENLVIQLRVLGTDREARQAAFWHGGGFWLFNALTLYLSLWAFGPQPSIGSVLVVFGVVSLLALLPLTPGGIGIVEGVAVPSLIAFGTPATIALAGVLTWRLFQFWLPIPVGGVTWIWLEIFDYRDPALRNRAQEDESS